jgi:hypothetical protein
MRYIGKALDMRVRYRRHFSRCRHEHSRKAEWIHELRAAGLEPDTIVLEDCAPSESAAREKYWIARARWRGIPLLNMKHGGQGRLDTSAETRKRISEGNKGKGHGPEWRAAHAATLRGRKASVETKAKMSRALTGNERARKWDYTAIFPDGRRVAIENVAAFCKEHGHTPQSIWNVAAGKRQTNFGLRLERTERRKCSESLNKEHCHA